MTDVITIWHNPRCSKSRAALARLVAEGRPLRVVRYLDEPPERATLEEVVALLPGGAAELLRAGEEEARALGVDGASAPEAILDALAAHPRLIQRPLVLDGKRALVARPPELLDAWLGDASQ